MSDDLIRREDAIKAVEERSFAVRDSYTVKAILRNVPSADRPQGEWKRRLVDNGFNADWVCSECGYRVKTDFVDYKFCPNCGAKMKGADDETD